MAEEHLRRLCRITPFSRLHSKLEDWLEEYNLNSCDQNVTRCCDIIELNARIQRELFKLLNKSASEGGLYGGASAIKSRFLPWLGQEYIYDGRSLMAGYAIRDQDNQLEETKLSLQIMEDELRAIHEENFLLRDQIKSRSSTDLKSLEYNPVEIKTGRKLKRGASLSSLDSIQELRQDQIVQRFKDMYYTERIDAMNTLRLYSDDQIRNEKIVFTVFRKACAAGRFALHQYKNKLRDLLDDKYDGPQSRDQLAQDFIYRNTGPYDLSGMISDVIRDVDSSISHLLPASCSIAVIRPFIRESCKLGWEMASLIIPLDIDLGIDTVFDPIKYRRSVNSDYSSHIVSHFIWPCLYLGSSLASSRKVVSQGEVETRSTVDQRNYRSRSPSPRSRSPTKW